MVTVANPPDPTLFGRTRQAVLGLLLEHADDRFYLRQIVRLTGSGVGAVQRELRHFVAAGVLTRVQEGRQVYFAANRESPIFVELQSLLRKTAGAPVVLRHALAPLVAEDRIALAFIYGSVAAGVPRASSDVDLCVIGTATLRELVPALQAAELQLGRGINPSVYPAKAFRRRLREGAPFPRRIVDGPKLFVVGEAHDLTRLAGESVAGGS